MFFSGSDFTFTICALSCIFCVSTSLFSCRSSCARSAPSSRSFVSFARFALCLPSSVRASSTAASSASICGCSSAACRRCVVCTSAASSVFDDASSCTSCCSSSSRSSRIASSLSPLDISARSVAIASLSSCARAAAFSSFARSAPRSVFSCFAFLSRFFSFSYVLSTTSCSFEYLLLYSCACATVSFPAAVSSSSAENAGEFEMSETCAERPSSAEPEAAMSAA